MKISFNPNLKNYIKAAILTGTFSLTTLNLNAGIKEIKQDSIEITKEVPAKGTTSTYILNKAPNPFLTIQGEKKTAKIVVDLSTNILFKYTDEGIPEIAYRIASGKKSTPTDTGLRVVSHVERYPYKSAPEKTRRYKKPWDYGPRIICLETLDPDTGRKGSTGEFIHGTNNPNSIGKYASLGCMRMDNDIIKKLSTEVKRGDLVLITKTQE